MSRPGRAEPLEVPLIENLERFRRAIALFDAANAEDPNTEAYEGDVYPRELLYAQRMTDRLAAFEPDASEAVQLAVRCQHIRRWTIPRSDYTMDRIGYKRWRTALLKFHAETAGGMLHEVGYDEPFVERVQTLLRKERLKRDDEVQLLEDVICLVFLDFYFTDFASRHDEAKLLEILRKTWVKMSPAGREAALGLDLPPSSLELVKKALAS